MTMRKTTNPANELRAPDRAAALVFAHRIDDLGE